MVGKNRPKSSNAWKIIGSPGHPASKGWKRLECGEAVFEFGVVEEVVEVDEAGQRARFDAQSGLFKNGHGVESTDDDGADALRTDGNPVEVLAGVAEAEQAAEPEGFELVGNAVDGIDAVGGKFAEAGTDATVAGGDGAAVVGHAAADEDDEWVDAGSVVVDDVDEAGGAAVS